MRRLAIVIGALALVAAACGDSDADTTAAATEAPATTQATTTTEATTTTTEATTTTTAAAAGSALDIELAEFTVAMPETLAAGSYEINLSNIGEFAHELVIVRADGYESLSQESNGAVIESDIAAEDFILRIDRIDGGATATGSVTLDPGNYVFFCNIAFGPNSHAGAGQTLDVTVTE